MEIVLVNLGAQMQHWTNDKYLATLYIHTCTMHVLHVILHGNVLQSQFMHTVVMYNVMYYLIY